MVLYSNFCKLEIMRRVTRSCDLAKGINNLSENHRIAGTCFVVYDFFS